MSECQACRNVYTVEIPGVDGRHTTLLALFCTFVDSQSEEKAAKSYQKKKKNQIPLLYPLRTGWNLRD